MVRYKAADVDVSYQNDFSTRTSLGPIGGTITFTDYEVGNLTGAINDEDGGQDKWVRRGSGTAPATVAEEAGNQFVRVEPITADKPYAHSYQQIGSDATLWGDGLRISIDMSSPSAWTYSGAETHGQYVFLGDDYFFEGSGDFTRWMASAFGFQEDSSNVTRFVVRPGDGNGEYSYQHGAAVDTSHWYRFVADLDFASNSYSLSIYDLDTDHPTLDTSTPATPVQTFTGIGFVRDLGTTSSDLRGITAIGLSTYRNSTGMAEYDNIRISSIPEPGTVALIAVAGLCLLGFGRRRHSSR